MDVWSWICKIPNSDEFSASDSELVRELASSNPSRDAPTQSILLRAQRAQDSNPASLTFSVCVQGFHCYDYDSKAIWVSDACPLSIKDEYKIPLVSQLVEDIISRSPAANGSSIPRSRLQKLLPQPIARLLETHSVESFSSFFDLVLLTRLFWMCACDAPSEIGSFFFRALLAPKLTAALSSGQHAPVMRSFLLSVGADAELCFMRTLGYMLTKWLVFRDVGAGLVSLTPLASQHHIFGFSYATEAHGLWVLKGYAPLLSMNRTRSSRGGESNAPFVIDSKESVLKYALAHHQLESVIQLAYAVEIQERCILVKARVDNLRFHVAKLGFSNKSSEEDGEYDEEKHFPSRIQVRVGPEMGSKCVRSLSLARSTHNVEQELELQRVVRGSFGKSTVPNVKAKARTTTRTRTRNWRWDQDAEGNVAVFDAILYDGSGGGLEVATWKAPNEAAAGGGSKARDGFRRRYGGPNRAFGKTGGLIFTGDDEYGQEVTWRLNKDAEGSALKWRVEAQVWMTYWPNNVKSPYYETRLTEMCDEVDLAL